MTEPKSSGVRKGGPLAWMVNNSVAANLLMFVVVVGGLMGVLRTKQEVFPAFNLDQVTVAVAYPGASPTEVEQGIVLAIEERMRGLDGVKRVNSTAREGIGTVSVALLRDADPDQVLADIKNEVDRIITFPDLAEEPTVSLSKNRSRVISLVISGEQDLRALHDIAEKARQDLLADPAVSQVELEGVPPLEVSIEVPRETLRQYGLTLQQIANEVSLASLELPGGGIDSERGEILLRVADRRLRGHEFEGIVLRSSANGAKIRLGDIATIHDDYEDTDQYSLYDGKPAVRLTAYRVGAETPTAVAKAVRDFSEELRTQLPDNITLSTWSDESEILEQRIDLLLKNAIMGLALVVVILALFLDFRLAFWVALGIPISFLGSFVLLGGTDLSINMITLFAFIVTLGMVVDDAIVVGERAYALMAKGLTPMDASVRAAQEMVVPITFAILTTIAAFSPLLFVPGIMGKIFKMIPMVVIAVLLLSLLESFLILPAHLGHSRGRRLPRKGLVAGALRVQARVASGLETFIERVYRPVVAAAIRQRYLTLAAATSLFVLTVGLVASGKVPYNFFPQLEGDVVVATARLPYGTPLAHTERVQEHLEIALAETIEEFGGRGSVRGVFTRVGEEAPRRGPRPKDPETGSHIISIETNLVTSELRDFKAVAFADAWRGRLPEIAGLESLSFSAESGPGAGDAAAVQLVHADTKVLGEASRELESRLRDYPALTNVRNDYTAGKTQLDFHLRPEARALGLSATDVARQLRSAFYGAEAIREQRGRNEIKVIARLPQEQRRSEQDLDDLMIRTPRGGDVPLANVAEFDRGRSATAIYREDGARTITVSAQLRPEYPSPRPTLESLNKEVFPGMRTKYPGLEVSLVGAQSEQKDSVKALGEGYLLALFVIFALLAVPFRSYVQPVIIMIVIPFGAVGAVAGHLLMGYGLSLMSMFGFIALSGVVVNDSLVLIDASNRERREGKSPLEAIIGAGVSRFRPILLTSLTTFFGLVPMIAETSVQARFLIPMAISLAFGVLYATVMVLLVVPPVYMIVEDLRGES